MAALSSDVVIEHKEEAHIVSLPVVASDIIYQGALCMLNAAGYLAPCTPTASSFFAGIAAEQKDNSSGNAGDVNCLVFISGLHKITPAGTLQVDDILHKVFAETDNHTDATLENDANTTNAQYIGRVVSIDGTDAWVDIGMGVANQELAI